MTEEVHEATTLQKIVRAPGVITLVLTAALFAAATLTYGSPVAAFSTVLHALPHEASDREDDAEEKDATGWWLEPYMRSRGLLRENAYPRERAVSQDHERHFDT